MNQEQTAALMAKLLGIIQEVYRRLMILPYSETTQYYTQEQVRQLSDGVHETRLFLETAISQVEKEVSP